MAVVYMKHIRQARYCAAGARTFFKRYGLDWRDFLKNGIDERKLLDTADAMAIRVVEVANGR